MLDQSSAGFHQALLQAGYVYAILVTSKSQAEGIIEGMEAGADDFVCKPFDCDELRVRLRAGQRVIELDIELPH
jgi:DNA-binding response OmpR family regulator